MSRRVIPQRPLSLLSPPPQLHRVHGRALCASAHVGKDPRIPDLGKEIIDDYAQLREHYGTFY